MLKTICPRCGKLIPYGEVCPCRAKDKRNRNRTYDKNVRYKQDAELTAFYHSKEWKAMQPYIIAKYSGIDIYAYYIQHEIIPAKAVHHIKPLREIWSLRLNENNLIPLSISSHATIEALYKTKKKQETQTLLVQLLNRWNIENGL